MHLRALPVKKSREREREREREVEWYTGQFFSIHHHHYHPFHLRSTPLCFISSLSLLLPAFSLLFSFSCNIERRYCKMQPRMSCENIDALWAATVYSGPRPVVLQRIIDFGFYLTRPGKYRWIDPFPRIH